MNRCFFIATPGGGGAVAYHFMALGKTLAAKGHRVVLLIDGQRKEEECHSTNFSIFTWPSKRPIKFQDAYFLFKLIRKFHPDCLIANFGAVNLMMLVGWLTMVPVRICWNHTLSTQIAMDFRRSWWKEKYLYLRKKMIFKMTSRIVAVSQATKYDICREYGLLPNKVKVSYNLLSDLINKYDHNIPLSRKINSIICVGRFFPSKGQDVLVKATAIVNKEFSDVYVQFVGKGPTKDYCIQLSEDLNVGRNCIFLGMLPHIEVIKRMAKSYVTIIPSHSEAFGYVIIESMSVGTPVIASDVGGIPEIVRDGEDGFIVPDNDPVELAEKIKTLLGNDLLRENMGINARRHYQEKFQLETNIKSLVDWLESNVNNTAHTNNLNSNLL